MFETSLLQSRSIWPCLMPHMPMTPHKNADAKSANGAALTTGELRNVDKDTGKVTNKHGPIQNLDMSAASI
ncbi:MAG: copper-binding protein [Pseudomonadota bacterium]|nr:copper-binding protein [Pseudomonadota bacterium]